MITNMTSLSCQLNNLLTALPGANSYRSSSELTGILNKYIRILDYVNSYNPEYKSATRVYYSDITTIRDNIQNLSYASSQQEKDKAFERVKKGLKTDLLALATLIQPKEEFA